MDLHLASAGPPLHSVAGPPISARPIAPASLLDRAARNQIVIFDPACAPLLQPVLPASDLRPWHSPTGQWWRLAIPSGWTAKTLGPGLNPPDAWQKLAARYPLIAQRLAPLAPANVVDYWWEEPPVAPVALPFICWPSGAAAPCWSWVEAAALPVGAACYLPQADPYMLGLLASDTVWAYLSASAAGQDQPECCSAVAVAAVPIPAAAAAERSAVGDLALNIVAEARTLADLEHNAGQRLLKNLGPPGAQLSPALQHWWQLNFPSLRRELVAAFNNDIPLNYRDEWEDWLVSQRRAHHQFSRNIANLTGQLNTRVAALYERAA